MEVIELKFLLKLLGHDSNRALISKIQPNSKTKASQRDNICRELRKRELVDCTEEVTRIKIAAGKALLKSDEAIQELSQQELKILQACKDKAITPGETKVTPSQTRRELIDKLAQQGLITAETRFKEVWLTDKGKEYIAKEYDSRGGGNFYISKKMLADYLDFLRGHLSAETPGKKPTDTEILTKIVDCDREYNTDNYLPIFYLRQEFGSTLSRVEVDQALYRLQASDKIELSTLAEVDTYTPEEINAGIPQPVGGALFFITVN